MPTIGEVIAEQEAVVSKLAKEERAKGQEERRKAQENNPKAQAEDRLRHLIKQQDSILRERTAPYLKCIRISAYVSACLFAVVYIPILAFWPNNDDWKLIIGFVGIAVELGILFVCIRLIERTRKSVAALDIDDVELLGAFAKG